MKIFRSHYANETDGLTLLTDPTMEIEGSEYVYGVGVDFPQKETLPEWAQNQMRLIDMFNGETEAVDAIPGVGYRGSVWYEFIGPKWEGEIDDNFKR